ncbi:hypothetical protein CVD28_06205 [Bacillus sp. M6-12]|uniref:hypothetical protein n=1 Tax=Bacillus sp. M6-12 TaxID=2054166 RepID=UPI000C793CAB|nr:hypothetical protein [Bacillus sp. M6-12]PLS18709.1 hypothetical protein CVD28_06205 [Bacillus sp. M6-12]
MYKVMFINALTKETLREEICNQPKIFNGLIQDLKALNERKSSFLVFDDRGRTLEANYGIAYPLRGGEQENINGILES